MSYGDKPAMKQMSDPELAHAVKEGNDTAFEEMAGRYVGFLYSLASGFSAYGFDKNDFVQEGLMILLAACKTYDQRAGMSFRNYLSLCVKRRYISIQRKSDAKGAVPPSSMISIDDAAESADCSFNPEELLINAEHIKSVVSQLEDLLSPLEQKVLSHYLSGCSYLEISNKAGISVKSVDNALQRIRKKSSLIIK